MSTYGVCRVIGRKGFSYKPLLPTLLEWGYDRTAGRLYVQFEVPPGRVALIFRVNGQTTNRVRPDEDLSDYWRELPTLGVEVAAGSHVVIAYSVIDLFAREVSALGVAFEGHMPGG